MNSDAERCAEYEKFKNIDAAFRAADLAALRAAIDDPDIVPNGPMPLTIGPCLEYAIYRNARKALSFRAGMDSADGSAVL